MADGELSNVLSSVYLDRYHNSVLLFDEGEGLVLHLSANLGSKGPLFSIASTAGVDTFFGVRTVFFGHFLNYNRT